MWGVRAAWLGRPWFFLAIITLVLNDHLLKQNSPSWLTGKLSDFAGLIVIGTLFSVLAGATWGGLLAGLGFLGLKTIPGVAEVASPLLGGVTLRDPTDLIALSVLPILWWRLRHPHPDQAVRDRRAWQAIGLVTAVLATTATSSSSLPEPSYLRLGAAPWAILASVEPGDSLPSAYLSSRDGGLTWSRIDQTRALGPQANWGYRLADKPCGADVVCYQEWSGQDLEVCADDGVCFRLRDGDSGTSTIERRAPASAWQVDGKFNQSFNQLVIERFNSDHVVIASDGARTVFHRSEANSWLEVDLAPLAATELERLGGRAHLIAGSPFGSLATYLIVLFLILHRLPPSGARTTLIVATSMVSTLSMLRGLLSPSGPGFSAPTNLALLIATGLLILGRRLRLKAE